MEIRQNNLTPHVPAFKVTQGHWKRHGSISYLWLPASDPYYTWAYRAPSPW